MGDEQRYVAELFIESFDAYKDKRIILYGVGINTQAILENASGFEFMGLMDQATEGQTIYWYPVLTEKEAVLGYNNDRIIVIVARESVVDIIYKRIEHLHDECGIGIYDVSGHDLSQRGSALVPNDIPYWNTSFDELCQEIDRHDVISFDIFDTLLMRRVLQPKDVFDLVERAGANGFTKERISAEKRLDGKYPTLDEIYEEMGEDWKQYKQLEVDTDRNQLILRKMVADVFRYAVDCGKKVYILSDMYYTSDHLMELLDEHGISGYKDVLVSCELRASKEDDGRAYDIFRKRVYDDCGREVSFLHIGDNRYVDIDRARKHGLDTYQVYSGYELLMASSLKSLLVDMSSLEKRCVVGLLVAKLFSDPFVLNCTKGVVCVDERELFGYVFIAPMVTEYTRWMTNEVQKRRIGKLVFTARDGLLIKKIYDKLRQNDGYDKREESVYVRVSRRAVTVASIKDDEDIIRVATRGYSGTFRDMLMDRFGIADCGNGHDRDVKMYSPQELRDTVLEYRIGILEEVERERENYLVYLKRFGIDDDSVDDVVFFDFITSGTVPYNLSRIIGRDVTCMCFATMNLPNMMYEEDTDKLVSAYGNIRSYGNDTELSKHYLVLETILTDDKSSLLMIDDAGKELFTDDGVNHKFDEVIEVWDGVLEYVSDYLNLYGGASASMGVELELVDAIFGAAFSEANIISDEIKGTFVNDDAYDGIYGFSAWG